MLFLCRDKLWRWNFGFTIAIPYTKTVDYTVGEELIKIMDDIVMPIVNANAPEGPGKAIYIGDGGVGRSAFGNSIQNDGMKLALMEAILFMLPIPFPVIFITSANVITSLICTPTIARILGLTIGSFAVLKFNIGILEALCGMMAIGLSGEHCLQFCSHY